MYPTSFQGSITDQIWIKVSLTMHTGSVEHRTLGTM